MALELHGVAVVTSVHLLCNFKSCKGLQLQLYDLCVETICGSKVVQHQLVYITMYVKITPTSKL